MYMRNSVKAFIVKDGKLLTIKGIDHLGDFYLLPGGGQRPGETMLQALQRECREEINCNAEVGDILYIREYIGQNHEFSEYDREVHQIEYMFFCELPEACCPKIGNVPDNNQVDIAWLELSNLSEYRLYPQDMREIFSKFGNHRQRIYFGDIN